jgi:hypothetical protein
MYTRLLHMALLVCVAIGDRILAPLLADQRLAELAAIFRAAQAALVARVTAAEELTETARKSTAACADALRLLGDTLREFGLFLLALTRNHPGLDPYPGYYPDGYGEALKLDAPELADFAGVTITKLEGEADPRIRAHLEPITAAHDAYVAAEGTARTDARARDEAIALAQKERRTWARALVTTRHRAEDLCFGDRAYIRRIFAPAMAPRPHNGAPEAPEAADPVEAPASQDHAV